MSPRGGDHVSQRTCHVHRTCAWCGSCQSNWIDIQSSAPRRISCTQHYDRTIAPRSTADQHGCGASGVGSDANCRSNATKRPATAPVEARKLPTGRGCIDRPPTRRQDLPLARTVVRGAVDATKAPGDAEGCSSFDGADVRDAMAAAQATAATGSDPPYDG